MVPSIGLFIGSDVCMCQNYHLTLGSSELKHCMFSDVHNLQMGSVPIRFLCVVCCKLCAFVTVGPNQDCRLGQRTEKSRGFNIHNLQVGSVPIGDLGTGSFVWFVESYRL